jgi:hypothetical protein
MLSLKYYSSAVQQPSVGGDEASARKGVKADAALGKHPLAVAHPTFSFAVEGQQDAITLES